jgi:phosphomevalonate kinase
VKTGESVKTGEKLKINLPESFYDKSNEIVRSIEKWHRNFACWYPTEKFRRFKQFLLKNQRLLISYLPEGYVTPKLALALKLINDQENLVGKISGSGFGENIIVFAKNEKGIKKIREKLGRNGILLEKVQIAKEVK